MSRKQFKYAKYLRKYPNCPHPSSKVYKGLAFRWLYEGDHKNNFLPALLINPNRTFENDTMYCSAYGLSMFNTEEGALAKYKKLTSGVKKNLRGKLGTLLGRINIEITEGVATEPEKANFGHFDYYEYEEVDLSKKIVNFVQIFDENGEFKR